ncbi:MAG TPA: hypothetical protein VK177_12435 [Flavobacteriales bacterium]|nr:hypothetical protein [Flavobacteriales bacterium]
MCCVIIDNGVGRTKSPEGKKTGEHRSFGTLITRERLAIINQLYESGLSENIVDLYDADNKGCGTRVEIFIPFNV